MLRHLVRGVWIRDMVVVVGSGAAPGVGALVVALVAEALAVLGGVEGVVGMMLNLLLFRGRGGPGRLMGCGGFEWRRWVCSAWDGWVWHESRCVSGFLGMTCEATIGYMAEGLGEM